MTVLLVQAQEIKFIQIDNTPGILPFKLGTAHIITSKHIFLYDIDINILKSEVTELTKVYVKLNSSLSVEEIPHSQSLRNSYDHLSILIAEMNQKLSNIQFKTSNANLRQKRGLFNAVGTVQKWLFGTLDANDEIKYENALKTLKDNQQKIVKQVNSQISLSKSLIQKYSKDIELIISNQQKMSKFITQYSRRLENVTNEFYKYTVYFAMIDQLFMNANVIITFLDNLENAITFSKLHVVHPDILNNQNLDEILLELSVHYQQNEILQINKFSWFSIIHTNCYFSENKIVFAIEIPIVNPKTYQYFHLFPIPTKTNYIIVPNEPYLALEENNYQYMEQPCKKTENIYICDHKKITSNPAEDCISALIQDKSPRCTHTAIERPQIIFNKINEEYLIIISSVEIKIKSRCPDEQYHTLLGNLLVQIPVNCTLEYKTFKFGNTQNVKIGKPLLLPKLSEFVAAQKNPTKKFLRIKNIPLEEIHTLKKQADAINPISIEDIENYSTNNWTLWLCIGLIFIIIIVYATYNSNEICRRPVPKKKSETKTEEKSRNSPSILYQPEAVS